MKGTKVNTMAKRLTIALLAGLMTFLPVESSFAGSGSNEIVTVSWKDWKKSKAKGCARQKITVTLAQPTAFHSVKLSFYNDDDEELTTGGVIFENSGPSAKLSTNFQFCDPLGPGPYYVTVSNGYAPSWGLRAQYEFDIPYKFKK